MTARCVYEPTIGLRSRGSFPSQRGGATSNQTLGRKKRQRHQGTQTAKDNTKSEECPECIARGVGAVLDFRIVWKEDDRRDTHGRAECDAMRDQMPPVNMVIAPEMLVAQATTVRLFETKGANFDTLRNILTFERESIRSILVEP